jgi:4-amino-4-deoxy-L-arabinose transferase and related glycosyltransferases of PMT family
LSHATLAPARSSAALESPATPAVAPERHEPDWRVVLPVVLFAGGAYVRWYIGRGWMPFDDGALAQSAGRLTQGELPHRDFIEIYTGGLTWLNAVGFRLFGTTLWTLRLVLFACVVAWMPAVFYIASRFTRPVIAGGVTLLAIVWSVPNYPAAMPSWYNLFLATFGVAALCRHLEDGRARWLFAAGVAGGLSFLVKVVGLYYVAGVLLYLVFDSHSRSRENAHRDASSSALYAAFVTASLVLFGGALVMLARRQAHAAELVHFVVPGMAIAALLAWNEWTRPAGSSRARFVMLARLLAPFLLGVAVPIAIVVALYLRAGALGAFVHGVFVLPMRRFGVADVPAQPLLTMAAVAPIALALWWAQRSQRPGRTGVLIVALVLTLLLLASGTSAPVYRGVWNATRNLVPLLTLLGVALLASERGSLLVRRRMMLLISVTALCSLVQFPYVVPNYFCYVAPLVVLTALAMSGYLRPSARVAAGAWGAFLAAFAVLRVNGSPLQSMGVVYQPAFPMATLTLERGGIAVPRVHAAVYQELIPALAARAHGGYTWAAPDSPEIYFLSGLRNPTRSLFEFFDDSADAEGRVLAELAAHGITAIVLNAGPSFSAPISQRMFVELSRRYPHARNFDPFQLRWRE